MAIDTVTGQYYVSLLNGNNSIDNNAIYDGSLSAVGAPQPTLFMNIGQGKNINTNPDLSANGIVLDNAPTLAVTNGVAAGTDVVQGKTTPVILLSGETLSDTDNTVFWVATVKVTNGLSGDQLFVSQNAVNTQNGTVTLADGAIFDVSYVGGTTDTLTITNHAGNFNTLTDYEVILGEVTYEDLANDLTNIGTHTSRNFSFTVNDGVINSNAATTSVTIDRPPVAVADTNSALEGKTITGNVLANDTDRDGDTITVTNVIGNEGSGAAPITLAGIFGTLTIAANGSYTYTADNTTAIDAALANSHPTDVFSYTEIDGLGGSASSTLTITIDRPPVANPDTNTDLAGKTITVAAGGVLTNDTDKDGDGLTVTNAGTLTGSFGHLTLGATGGYTYAADNAAAIAAITTGTHGVDAFTYQESDGKGGTASSTLSITIDRAPTAVNDTAADLEGATVTATAATGVFANDTDKDGDTLTVTTFSGTGSGAAGSSVAGTFGHLKLNADGSYSYTADLTTAINTAPAGVRPVDVFTYTETDGGLGTTTATLSITRWTVRPVAADRHGGPRGLRRLVDHREDAAAGVLADDMIDTLDPSHDTLTLTGVSSATGGAGTIGTSLAGKFGHLTLNSDGSYTYAADNTTAIDAAANGGHLTDVFTYAETDGGLASGTSSATLTVTIDRPPTAGNDVATDLAGATVTKTAVTGVLSNDTDRDADTLTIASISDTGGSVSPGTALAGTYGHLTLNANGSYSYAADNAAAIATIATGSHGVDVFTYAELDGKGATVNPTLSVTIDRAPTAVNDSANASGGVGATLTVVAASGVLANDTDPDGDSLTVTGVSDTTSGNGSVGAPLVGQHGALTLNSDGSYSYVVTNLTGVPDGTGHIHDVFTYAESDGLGGTATAQLDVAVAVNPVAGADNASDLEGQTITAAAPGVLTNDTDPGGAQLTVTSVSDTTSGTVTPGTALAGAFGSLTLNADGSYTYAADNTAAIDAAPAGTHALDVFTYVESNGTTGTASATLTIEIDRAPVAANDSSADVEGVTIQTTAATGVLANDTDTDGDGLTVTSTGTFTGTFGTLVMAADGSYSYVGDNTAAIDGFATGGHAVDAFSYSESDGHGGTADGILSITIDRPPVAANDGNVDVEGATVTATAATGVFANDTDADGDALTVTTTGTFSGAFGTLTLNADGSYSYVAGNIGVIDAAPAGSKPTDVFSYTESDGHGGTAVANLSIAIDRNPVAQNDTNADLEGATITATAATGVLANDTDRDGDTLTVTSTGSFVGSFGTLSLNADGSYSLPGGQHRRHRRRHGRRPPGGRVHLPGERWQRRHRQRDAEHHDRPPAGRRERQQFRCRRHHHPDHGGDRGSVERHRPGWRWPYGHQHRHLHRELRHAGDGGRRVLLVCGRQHRGHRRLHDGQPRRRRLHLYGKRRQWRQHQRRSEHHDRPSAGRRERQQCRCRRRHRDRHGGDRRVRQRHRRRPRRTHRHDHRHLQRGLRHADAECRRVLQLRGRQCRRHRRGTGRQQADGRLQLHGERRPRRHRGRQPEHRHRPEPGRSERYQCGSGRRHHHRHGGDGRAGERYRPGRRRADGHQHRQPRRQLRHAVAQCRRLLFLRGGQHHRHQRGRGRKPSGGRVHLPGERWPRWHRQLDAEHHD